MHRKKKKRVATYNHICYNKATIKLGGFTMETENKTTTIKIRVSQDFKDTFNAACKQKAINPSELLRQLIEKWLEHQKE